MELKEISNKEDEVDEIVSSSRLFATSLQVSYAMHVFCSLTHCVHIDVVDQ